MIQSQKSPCMHSFASFFPKERQKEEQCCADIQQAKYQATEMLLRLLVVFFRDCQNFIAGQ